MLDADFELRLYESDRAVTGPSLGELYLEVVREFYGDLLTLRDGDADAWLQTPHYYTSPLYMGRYGLSSAAANALIAGLASEKDSDRSTAQQTFLELLQAGASDYPTELLRRAGVDLEQPETIAALSQATRRGG